jgi:L-lactate dehydrogenase complex protein LldG
MSSREKILAAVKNNQPGVKPLPAVSELDAIQYPDVFLHFTNVLQTIGGKLVEIKNNNEITAYIKNNFTAEQNFVTTIHGLGDIKMLDENLKPHFLENIDVAIVKALFAVAENGSVWLTDAEMRIRALPFICQHLAVVLQKKEIVSNMQQAYELIGNTHYNFGVFIAGPSKTADIEQSLVLGAHGPKTMTVFVME